MIFNRPVGAALRNGPRAHFPFTTPAPQVRAEWLTSARIIHSGERIGL
jgi:hypothetical protein